LSIKKKSRCDFQSQTIFRVPGGHGTLEADFFNEPENLVLFSVNINPDEGQYIS